MAEKLTQPREKTASRTLRRDLAPSFHNRLEESEGLLRRGGAADARPELTEPLLVDAIRVTASDIRVEPHSQGSRVRLRVDGVVWDVAHLPDLQARLLVNQFKALAGLDPVTRFTPSDAHCKFELPDVRVDMRLALAPSTCGEILSIRLLDPKRLERSISDLGLSPQQFEDLTRWLKANSGMFLAAGPTGSGKTTTVYALLHELKSSQRTIISLEDPVEYQIDGITQIQVDELHQLTFAQGARSMLRLDPDYLMLGEIRDATSAHTATTAALTGRVLLTTIHCRDAVGAVTALRNWGVADHEIGEAVNIIVAQRLIRKLCLKCRNSVQPTEADRQWLKSFGLNPPRKLWTADGCKECRNLGYLGRTGAFEVWRIREEDYRLILNGADEHALREHLRARGHLSLMGDALAKATQGVTSLGEIRRIAAGIYPGQIGIGDGKD